MPSAFSLNATAKVNLYLHVCGKRGDGYHLLDSLVAFPKDIHDVVTLTPSSEFSLTVDGPFAEGLSTDHSNLVVRAAEAMSAETAHALDCSIKLTKNIPLGSGLGGGSSDAAGTIKALEQYWDLKISDKQHQDMLLKLGADVPVCYAGAPCRFQGVGEKISPRIALPPLFIALVWPGKPSFTKNVFGQYKKAYAAPLPDKLPAFTTQDDLLSFLKSTENSLQDPAEYLCPEIAQARAFMESQNGNLLTRMTGSGATIFGLFESQKLCEQACQNAKDANSAWWCRDSAL